MKWRWCSQGHDMLEKWENVDCHWWRTLQLDVNHINILWLNCRQCCIIRNHMSDTLAHTLTSSLFWHIVPYLSKHTHSCLPCPSDGIVKKVNLWRVLSAAEIIHFDESVHILKVSSLKPFGGMDVLLDMKEMLHKSPLLSNTDGASRHISLNRKLVENDNRCWWCYHEGHLTLSEV